MLHPIDEDMIEIRKCLETFDVPLDVVHSSGNKYLRVFFLVWDRDGKEKFNRALHKPVFHAIHAKSNDAEEWLIEEWYDEEKLKEQMERGLLQGSGKTFAEAWIATGLLYLSKQIAQGFIKTSGL